MKLLGSIVAVGDLDAVDRDGMFALMDRMYANMNRDSFERDLDAKEWILRLDDPAANRLVGFSTQKIIEVHIDGRPIKALFSGDTVVDRQHWGDTALASTWGNFALQLIDSHRDESLYWFLISKGFRTYRYLPLFFREYAPRCDAADSDEALRIIDALGRFIAPEQYDSRSRILRADTTKEYVRSRFGDVRTRSRHDRHVEYFVRCNPGYARGDELCCLAPLTHDNFTPLAWRMIRTQPPVPCIL